MKNLLKNKSFYEALELIKRDQKYRYKNQFYDDNFNKDE